MMLIFLMQELMIGWGQSYEFSDGLLCVGLGYVWMPGAGSMFVIF